MDPCNMLSTIDHRFFTLFTKLRRQFDFSTTAKRNCAAICRSNWVIRVIPGLVDGVTGPTFKELLYEISLRRFKSFSFYLINHLYSDKK